MDELEKVWANTVKILRAHNIPEDRRQMLADKYIVTATKGQVSSVQSLQAALQQQDMPKMSAGAAAAGGAAQTATFGFMDELAGAGAAMIPGGRNYQQMRDLVRGGEDIAKEQQGGAYFAGELAGGLIPIGGGAAAARGAGGFLRGAARALPMAAGMGGLYGAGQSRDETPGGVAVDALMGAGLGGLGGAVVAGGAGAIGALGRKASHKIQEITQPLSIARQRALEWTERQLAASKLRDPRGAAAKMAEMVQTSQGSGIKPILADVAPELQRQLRTAGNLNPSVESEAVALLRARRADTPTAVSGLLRELGETPPNPELMGKAPAERAKEILKVVGEQVYGPLEAKYAAVPMDQAKGLLDRMAKSEKLQALYRRGVKLTKLTDAGEVPLIDFADGSWTVKMDRLPGSFMFKDLQLMRQRLAEQAETAFARGSKSEGVVLKDGLKELDRLLEDAIPGFGDANRRYAQTSAVVESYARGGESWGRHMLPREMDRELEDLVRRAGTQNAEAVRRGYRFGAIDEAAKELVFKNTNRDAVGGFLDAGKAAQEQLRRYFRNDRSYRRFMNDVGLRRIQTQTLNAFGNSTTTGQLGAREAALQGGVIQDAAGAALQGGAFGGPVGAASAGTREVGRRLTQNYGEALGEEAGKILMQNPPEAYNTLDLLRKIRSQRLVREGREGRIGGALAGAGGMFGGINADANR